MNEENIETLRWSGNHLEMIDQRILPEEFTYISYTSAKSVAEGIKSMVIRGAPAIGHEQPSRTRLKRLTHD